MNLPHKTIVTVRDLTVQIDTLGGVVQPLDRISFELREGETFALVGESGCGKSMTAFSLMRLLPPGGRIAAGGVRLGETELCSLTEAEMRNVRGGQLAMIFQEPGTSLNPVFTVAQQVTEVLRLHRKLDGAAARQEALALLKQVGIPDPERRLDEYPFQFSGGMNQRVMIAMALAGQPRLLIADEPTTALDVTIQAQVLDLLAQLQREQGMGVLLITHDLGVVAKMAHRIGVMYAGQLVEEAPRESFFRAPAHPYARKLFESLPVDRGDGGRLATISGNVPAMTTKFVGCRFAGRCPAAFARCHTHAPDWYPLADGHRVRCHLYDPVESARSHAPAAVTETRHECKGPGVALLEVRDLKVHFPIHRGVFQRVVGHVHAVDGVSLTVRAGRTLALVGESGCGKTTVGKAILRLLEPTAGSVRLDGTEVTAQSGSALRALRTRMQMVFQDPFGSLNPRLRVAELIEEGMVALGLGGDAGARHARLLALMAQVGLTPEMADRYPHEFSGGQRQRIAIARALAVSPKLIICDEPTSALDVSVQAQILNLLEDLQRDLGLSLLFITHNLSVVEYLAHDVAVMYLGRIVESGTVAEVLRHPQHPYTKALLAAVPQPTVATGELQPTPPVRGDMPSPSRPPSGCHFHPRCPVATDACRVSYPEISELAGGHTVRCHLAKGG